MVLFNYVPPQIRPQVLAAVKGQRAVKFPAAYFRKCPMAQHPLWQNVCSMDSEGMVVKTAPDGLVELLLDYLCKHELDYEVIQL